MEDISSKVIDLAQKHIGEFHISNNQLIAKYCPFCNGGEHNDKNTFAIGLYNGAWQCLRGQCKQKGTFKTLCNYFGEQWNEGVQMPVVKKKKDYSKPDPSSLLPITDTILQYFATRRISKETVEHFKIASDEKGNITFPFYKDGEYTFVKFRRPYKFDKSLKMPKEWSASNLEPILFGMDSVTPGERLYITEGEIDAMSLYEAGITNVVSVPSGCNEMNWITNCWDWLEQFQQIVIFGDKDEPGIEMSINVAKRLGEDRCMTPTEYPEFFVGEQSLGRCCKDANEILFCYGPETLSTIANSCEPAPVNGLLNLADVKFVDPSSLKRIYTKIPSLDSMIGGLTEGSVLTITGKRGCGKSTLNGTLLLNAIQQGEKVCAYSGELSAQNFLNWILVQATETQYISVTTDKNSHKEFTCVEPVVEKRIRDWIDGKFFLFDNSAFGDVEQTEAILNIFTIAAKRYGVKVFLCD